MYFCHLGAAEQAVNVGGEIKSSQDFLLHRNEEQRSHVWQQVQELAFCMVYSTCVASAHLCFCDM